MEEDVQDIQAGRQVVTLRQQLQHVTSLHLQMTTESIRVITHRDQVIADGDQLMIVRYQVQKERLQAMTKRDQEMVDSLQLQVERDQNIVDMDQVVADRAQLRIEIASVRVEHDTLQKAGTSSGVQLMIGHNTTIVGDATCYTMQYYMAISFKQRDLEYSQITSHTS